MALKIRVHHERMIQIKLWQNSVSTSSPSPLRQEGIEPVYQNLRQIKKVTVVFCSEP